MRGQSRGVLSARGRRKLQGIAKSKQEKARTKIRATVLLMTDTGIGKTAISKLLGISIRTVIRIRRRWRRCGLNGLADLKRPGRPPLANGNYLRKLTNIVEKDPRNFGYAFRRWTAPRLSEYMSQKTGIRVTSRWITKLLHRSGFVWKRTKQTTVNLTRSTDIRRAYNQLERLKKGLYRATQTMNSGTLTE